ncbi:MAG: aminodeoxyfutalosine deaminase [Verrucomicrobiota bacterium]|jgi:cytosine/adenosine deaminase-related metal-dependent hydrolase
MILRARTVVTMEGPPIANGAVAISGNRIVGVGTVSELRTHHIGETKDLGEQVLLPGLINTHCHLDYTCLRGKILPQRSFTDWIRAINAEKEKLSAEDYLSSIAEGFSECRRFGTTSIANLEAFPDLIPRLKPHPLRTWWFAELIDVRNPEAAESIVTAADQSLKQTDHWGLAPHSPYTASAALYRQCAAIADRDDILLTTHLAESEEEMSMFSASSGALYRFLEQLGREMNDCGEETPISHFLSSISATVSGERTDKQRWILAHLNKITENDFVLLKESAHELHVVHCPRSHHYFEHGRFELERLRDLGFNICLGTDSLASNDDLSLFAEMRALQRNYPNVRPEYLLETVTLNPARALGQESALGKISPGFYADLITIPDRRTGHLFEQIIGFDQTVPWMMIDGQSLV